MTITHTPGPWKIEKTAGCKEIKSEYVDKCGNKSYICTTAGREENEDRANARLIAAAPELLDLLKAAKRALHDPRNPEFAYGGKYYPLPTLLEQAITKAGGKI